MARGGRGGNTAATMSVRIGSDLPAAGGRRDETGRELPAGWRTRVLVPAVTELRWVGRVWTALGLGAIAAAVAAGTPGRLTALEAWGAFGLFGLVVSGSLAGLLIGQRTPPAILYARIFQVAPEPPASARAESHRATVLRAVGAALGLVLALGVAAAAGLGVTLVLLGQPRIDLLTHLPEGAQLVAAGWTLVCGACSLRVAGWISRWQEPRGKVVLTRPLASGTLAHIYYVAERVR